MIWDSADGCVLLSFGIALNKAQLAHGNVDRFSSERSHVKVLEQVKFWEDYKVLPEGHMNLSISDFLAIH